MNETKYYIEHFQHGKLDDPELSYGASFSITALSRELLGKEAQLLQILSRLAVSIQPTRIEDFQEAYGWVRQRNSIIVARFQRSTTVESRERQSHFIQAHYAIVPMQILMELKGCVSPLFKLLEINIPRYHKLQILPPLEVNISELVSNLPSQLNENSIPFVQPIFQNDLTVFDGQNLSSAEKLDFLTNLVMCFPPRFRYQLTYMTALDTSIYRGTDFKIAFCEKPRKILFSWGNSNNLNPQKPPSSRKKSLGTDYTRWLKGQIGIPITENFFGEIRYPATKNIKEVDLNDLEIAAEFIRLRSWLYRTVQTREIVASLNQLPLILFKHKDLIYEEEIVFTFTALCRLKLNKDEINSMLSVGKEETIYFVDTMCRFVGNVPDLKFPMYDILSWMLERNTKSAFFKSIFNLVNALIENHMEKVVVELPWWKTTSFSNFFRKLLPGAKAVLSQKIPCTFQVIKCLAENRLDQEVDHDLLLQSYIEVDSFEWLYLTLIESVRAKLEFLLTTKVLKELNSIFESSPFPEKIANFIFEIHENQIWEKICTYTVNSTNNPSFTIEQSLVDLRDFLLSVLHWYPNSSKNPRVKLQIISYHIFEIFVNHLVETNRDIYQRDAKLNNWAEIYAGSIQERVPANFAESAQLEHQLLVSALARAKKEYPQIYIDILAAWSRKVTDVSVNNLYVWLAILSYHHRFPYKLQFKSNEFDSIMREIFRVSVVHFPSSPNLILDYLLQLSIEVRKSQQLATIWHHWLQELPFKLPSYISGYLEQLVSKFYVNELFDEARLLNNAIHQLRLYLQQSEEIIHLLKTAENSLKELSRFADYVAGLPNENDRLFFFTQVKRLLNEKRIKEDATSLARNIRNIVEKDTTRINLADFLKNL